MLGPQRLFEKRVVVKINLADRKVVGGAPVRVNAAEFFGRKRFVGERYWGSFR